MSTPAVRFEESCRRMEAIECRRCSVVCERVVLPGHCLASGCPNVYAIREHGAVYFGCVEKVFSAELDVSAFDRKPRAESYGSLRARRKPLDVCRSVVEAGYPAAYSWRACANPAFRRPPADASVEVVRRIVDGPGPRPV